MPIDVDFISLVRSAFNPFTVHSGTELMAPMLYSLVRMVRPVTLVELGSGYTTPFLLRALADNIEDQAIERRMLFEKTPANLPKPEMVDPQVAQAWFAAGDRACAVDPRFYLDERMPRLYGFERLASDDEYVGKLNRLIDGLGHSNLYLFTNSEGFVPEVVQQLPVDLIFIDYYGAQNAAGKPLATRQVFDLLWPHVNRDGGLLIFHNVPGDQRYYSDIEEIRQEHAAARDLDAVVLHERHKIVQNGCAILRRVDHSKSPEEMYGGGKVFEGLLEFMRRARLSG